MGVSKENTKIHMIELVYLLLSKNYMLEGVPVQAEHSFDVVIFKITVEPR